jgi:hypothetical protein
MVRRRVRRELGDPEVAPNGATIPVPQRRFTDEDIDGAINDALLYMGTEIGIHTPGEALISQEITYTPGEEGMVIPILNQVSGEQIYQVQDLTFFSNPREVSYVEPREIYENTETLFRNTDKMFYTFLGETNEEQGSIRILIRPGAEGKRFRIKYVALPFVHDGSDNDIVPLSARWSELIGKYASQRLRAINGDEEPPMDAITKTLELQFAKFKSRNRNKVKIQRLGQRWR